VRISALCPGFIPTPMTQQVPTEINGTRVRGTASPGIVGVGWAARHFVDGVALDKALITFPYGVVLAAQALHCAPLVVPDFALRMTPATSMLALAWGPSNPTLVSPTPARRPADAASAAAAAPLEAVEPSVAGPKPPRGSPSSRGRRRRASDAGRA